MRYRIVSWSGDNAVSDVIARERTGSLAVALKLARWSFEDLRAGCVTVFEDERPHNYRSVAELDDAYAAAFDHGR